MTAFNRPRLYYWQPSPSARQVSPRNFPRSRQVRPEWGPLCVCVCDDMYVDPVYAIFTYVPTYVHIEEGIGTGMRTYALDNLCVGMGVIPIKPKPRFRHVYWLASTRNLRSPEIQGLREKGQKTCGKNSPHPFAGMT